MIYINAFFVKHIWCLISYGFKLHIHAGMYRNAHTVHKCIHTCTYESLHTYPYIFFAFLPLHTRSSTPSSSPYYMINMYQDSQIPSISMPYHVCIAIIPISNSTTNTSTINAATTPSALYISNASSIVVIIGSTTKFRSSGGGIPSTVCEEGVKRAVTRGYEKLVRRHVHNYQRFFTRVKFELTPKSKGEMEIQTCLVSVSYSLMDGCMQLYINDVDCLILGPIRYVSA